MNKWTCKHFSGVINKKCNAGVEYDSVTIRPNDAGSAYRKPCIRWLERQLVSPLAPSQIEQCADCGTCDKFELPTADEIKKYEQEMEAAINRMVLGGS